MPIFDWFHVQNQEKMVKGTITTMVTRLFPWSFDCATAQELDNSINVFRARETETWRIVALKKVGFEKFELESVYMAKDFKLREPESSELRSYVSNVFPYAMPMTKKSEFFEDKLEKMKLRQDYRSL
ncbi:hypothetical protein HID58_063107 [Brassica napus]|uniref:Uncharacterized protein n=1 Tax=Brassica napus TaxID=3708 RepID=A0ABQ8A3A9_BRANA|nr:hypothetical protein HID58_063107 [Brassica napus]